ncbi:TPA: hypothetical protein ACN35C_004776, partial [Vibrio parahaemolyticus]
FANIRTSIYVFVLLLATNHFLLTEEYHLFSFIGIWILLMCYQYLRIEGWFRRAIVEEVNEYKFEELKNYLDYTFSVYGKSAAKAHLLNEYDLEEEQNEALEDSLIRRSLRNVAMFVVASTIVTVLAYHLLSFVDLNVALLALSYVALPPILLFKVYWIKNQERATETQSQYRLIGCQLKLINL